MVTLAPAAKAYGVVIPLAEKPEPASPTWLILALALPLLVILTDCVLVVPVFTLPKLRLAGDAASCPWGGCVPVPDKGTVKFELEALLATIKVPE